MIKQSTKQTVSTKRTNCKHPAKAGKPTAKASELPDNPYYGKAPSTNGRGH